MALNGRRSPDIGELCRRRVPVKGPLFSTTSGDVSPATCRPLATDSPVAIGNSNYTIYGFDTNVMLSPMPNKV